MDPKKIVLYIILWIVVGAVIIFAQDPICKIIEKILGPAATVAEAGQAAADKLINGPRGVCEMSTDAKQTQKCRDNGCHPKIADNADPASYRCSTDHSICCLCGNETDPKEASKMCPRGPPDFDRWTILGSIAFIGLMWVLGTYFTGKSPQEAREKFDKLEKAMKAGVREELLEQMAKLEDRLVNRTLNEEETSRKEAYEEKLNRLENAAKEADAVRENPAATDADIKSAEDSVTEEQESFEDAVENAMTEIPEIVPE